MSSVKTGNSFPSLKVPIYVGSLYAVYDTAKLYAQSAIIGASQIAKGATIAAGSVVGSAALTYGTIIGAEKVSDYSKEKTKEYYKTADSVLNKIDKLDKASQKLDDIFSDENVTIGILVIIYSLLLARDILK